MAQSADLKELHAGLKARCVDSVGFFVPLSTLNRLLHSAIDDSISNLVTQGLPTPFPNVWFRPARAAGVSPTISVSTNVDPFTVELASTPFEFVLEIFESAGQNLLSSVTFQFPSTNFLLEAKGFALHVRAVKASAVPKIDTNMPGRGPGFLALGWKTADEVATFERFESFVAFTGASATARLIADAMTPPQFAKAFSGLNLRGPLKLEHMTGGPVGEGVALIPGPGSHFIEPPCAKCTEDSTTAARIEITDYETSTGRWFVAASTGLHAPSEALKLPGQMGFYTYLPKPVFDQSFGPNAYPAISLNEEGSFAGFGYEWQSIVEFRQLRLEIDLADPGFVVTADCGLSIRGSVWIPLPCDERQVIGSFSVNGDINNIRIRVRLRLDRGHASLRLESVLENHNVQPLDVHVDAFRWPFDAILNRIVAHNAPGMVSGQLDEAVRKGRFQLAALGDLQTTLPYPFNGVAFNADAASILLGIFAEG